MPAYGATCKSGSLQNLDQEYRHYLYDADFGRNLVAGTDQLSKILTPDQLAEIQRAVPKWSAYLTVLADAQKKCLADLSISDGISCLPPSASLPNDAILPHRPDPPTVAYTDKNNGVVRVSGSFIDSAQLYFRSYKTMDATSGDVLTTFVGNIPITPTGGTYNMALAAWPPGPADIINGFVARFGPIGTFGHGAFYLKVVNKLGDVFYIDLIYEQWRHLPNDDTSSETTALDSPPPPWVPPLPTNQ